MRIKLPDFICIYCRWCECVKQHSTSTGVRCLDCGSSTHPLELALTYEWDIDERPIEVRLPYETLGCADG
jgi:hypothetical protein